MQAPASAGPAVLVRIRGGTNPVGLDPWHGPWVSVRPNAAVHPGPQRPRVRMRSAPTRSVRNAGCAGGGERASKMPGAAAASPERVSASAAAARPPLLWRAGAQLTAARRGHRPRAGGDHPACSQPGPRRRTGASSRRPLRLGTTAGAHRRSFSAGVLPLRWRDEDHRLHHRRPTVRDILVHLGEPITSPTIAPARGPPMWEATGSEHDPAADPLLQCAPAFEFDQRLSW